MMIFPLQCRRSQCIVNILGEVDAVSVVTVTVV